MNEVPSVSLRRICANLSCFYPPDITYLLPQLTTEIPDLLHDVDLGHFLTVLSGRRPDSRILLDFLNWLLLCTV